jgi:hypothetical protein
MLSGHVIIPGRPEKRHHPPAKILAVSHDPLKSPVDPIRIRCAHGADSSLAAREVMLTAAEELRTGLEKMIGGEVLIGEDSRIDHRQMVVDFGGAEGRATDRGAALEGDAFAISRPGAHSISLRAGSERGLIHAACDLLQRLGASFPPGAPAIYRAIEIKGLQGIDPYTLTPSFSRRGFVSDIMTWNYAFADRLELHLRHDREFVPWMARRGVNAFSYIRHAHDTRLRIEEVMPMLRAHGIASEYGGHVLQILLPRERFESDSSMFPADDNGQRTAGGNLCVSSRSALETVRDGAIRYVSDYPENEVLHIWGADVRRGAWCRCGACRELAPQHQYMTVVNAIAEALAQADEARPVGYLAYHDTIEPYPGLLPLPNVWVEWAPRERCYSHAIDDPRCDINPRYFDSLKRYLEIFEGRAHVFEYYADAILWGGLAFASPEIVARDLRAYHGLGIRSISCLTFGAYSLMAYPVNLETYVECARDVGTEPAAALSATARGRHPACAAAMSDAYRAIADASALVLDYADVMNPRTEAGKAQRKRGEIARAAKLFQRAIDGADAVLRSGNHRLARAESRLWSYSAQVLEGIVDYLAAKECTGAERARRGAAAIKKIAAAIEHVHAIELENKGTWGAYDLEWMREMWFRALQRGLEEKAPQHQERP